MGAEMSSWAALTWNIGSKNAFESKNMKSKYFGDLITNFFLILRVI